MSAYIKKSFITDLKEGDRFQEVFLVKTTKLGETRAGKPYMVLTVMDRSGEISGPVWDNAEEIHALCPAGTFVMVSGLIQSYRDKPQLKIEGVTRVDQAQVNHGDFYQATTHDIEKMAAELQGLVRSVKEPFLRKLLLYFFEKSDYWQRFKHAPAAKGMHHAYIGGLLEHTLSVAKAVDMLAGHYPGVDRSLVLTGAFLHDVGKLEELQMENGVIDYTVRGRLKGHLVIGSEMVAKAAVTIHDFPEELMEQVQHLILSHHGKHEFGSPTLPMTVEAFILSFLDDLDAKMNITEQLRRKMASEEPGWTDYQRSLERYLYLGGFPETEAEPGQSQRQPENQPAVLPMRNGKQQSLF